MYPYSTYIRALEALKKLLAKNETHISFFSLLDESGFPLIVRIRTYVYSGFQSLPVCGLPFSIVDIIVLFVVG